MRLWSRDTGETFKNATDQKLIAVTFVTALNRKRRRLGQQVASKRFRDICPVTK
jgi:hypothetical protein